MAVRDTYHELGDKIGNEVFDLIVFRARYN